MNARLILGRLALVLTVPTLNSQLSTLFAQGSLAPPGAPAPTLKTLDQIEPRTPISSLPFLITNPGAYYLTANLIGSGTDNGIIIQRSRPDVTVDLNGFALTGGSTSGNGITALALRGHHHQRWQLLRLRRQLRLDGLPRRH